MCPPEVRLTRYMSVLSFFVPLHPDPVLPELPDILPEIERIPHGYQSIADTSVIEVVFCLLGDLFSQIPRVPSDSLDDERFL